jgi:hypothetical protein
MKRRQATALLVLALLAGCTVDETDPTPVTEADGITGSTRLVDPREGGAVSSTSTTAISSSTSPQG